MTFKTPLGLLCLTTFPMGATNSVQVLQGNISFIIQDEMLDISAAFMDDVNVRGTPNWYETNSAGWYILTAFSDPPPQSTPIPCTLSLDHQHLSLDEQHLEVILENTGIC